MHLQSLISCVCVWSWLSYLFLILSAGLWNSSCRSARASSHSCDKWHPPSRFISSFFITNAFSRTPGSFSGHRWSMHHTKHTHLSPHEQICNFRGSPIISRLTRKTIETMAAWMIWLFVLEINPSYLCYSLTVPFVTSLSQNIRVSLERRQLGARCLLADDAW